MAKITRTIVRKTVFSGYVSSNPSEIKDFEVEGTVADPMDLDKFIENAEVEE